jgi:hypothetical protein
LPTKTNVDLIALRAAFQNIKPLSDLQAPPSKYLYLKSNSSFRQKTAKNFDKRQSARILSMQMKQSGSPNRFFAKRSASKGSDEDEESESEYDEEEASADYGEDIETERN